MITQGYYERYWTSEGFNPRRDHTPPFLQQLFDQYVDANDDCLDVGCGDGGTSGVHLMQCAKSYLGVDISENAVALAISKGYKARHIADASKLPFEDHSFDVVVCIEVLEHLFEPHRASAEARRVLRPGGRYIVTVPNAAHWRDRIDAFAGVWQPGGDDFGRSHPWRSPHIRFFRPATLSRMLAQAGFERVHIVGVPSPLTDRIPLLRNLSGRTDAASRLAVRWAPSLFAGSVAAIAFAPPNESLGTAG